MKLLAGTKRKVRQATAARALFVDQESMPLIQMRVVSEYGEAYEFDMNIQQAGQLIGQLTSAYNAIVPPINNYRGFGQNAL